jgi:hypothetical protein
MSYIAPFYWSKAFWKGILPGTVGLVVGIIVAKVYDLQQGQPLAFSPDEAEIIRGALTGLGLAAWGFANNWRKHNPTAKRWGLDDFWGLWPAACVLPFLLCASLLALGGCGTGPDGRVTLLPMVTTTAPDGSVTTRIDTEAINTMLAAAQSQYAFWGQVIEDAQARHDDRAAAEAQRKQEEADRRMRQLLEALELLRGPEAKAGYMLPDGTMVVDGTAIVAELDDVSHVAPIGDGYATAP